MSSPTPADLIDEAELSQLLAEHGPGQRRRVTLEVSARSFDGWLGTMASKANRRGEVVLVIRRPDGQVLLHTKRFYPEGVYRLPTGGVHRGEPVLVAAKRETDEETGLAVTVDRFLGTAEYEFSHRGRRLFFVSYVFLLQTGNGLPMVQDPKEEITGFRYVTLPEIRTVAAQLRAIASDWADWGHFRAVAHDLVADTLGASGSQTRGQ